MKTIELDALKTATEVLHKIHQEKVVFGKTEDFSEEMLKALGLSMQPEDLSVYIESGISVMSAMIHVEDKDWTIP